MIKHLLSALELRVPPPVVAALCVALMLALAALTPGLRLPFPGRLPLAALVGGGGLALALAGFRALRRAHTTVSPFSPHKTSVLVVTGIYARSRNPMYLGLALALAGVAIALAHPAAAIGPVVFVAWITRLQIVPEERVLAERMGSAYEAYRASTPRWF